MGWVQDLGLSIAWDGSPLPEATCAGDILIQWDNQNGVGDWVLAAGDLQTGHDLQTACLVSLFTDRLATPDFKLNDGTTDRRGWWADIYWDVPVGSHLWQLDRALKTRDTLALARRYCQDALRWLVTDGAAKSVEVDTQWVGPVGSTILGIGVNVIQPDGTAQRFFYARAWGDIATNVRPPGAPVLTGDMPGRRVGGTD
jgi:phage gp46-like protein